MIQALIGQKIDQTQRFLENGKRIPVTEVAMSDNVVVQLKTTEKDNYRAVQLGYGAKKKPTKALLGHVKKAKLTAVPSLVREVPWQSESELPMAGDMITVESVFKPGDIVKVTGTSKGKGFAGVVRRYNFRGGPKTHGQSDRHRAPGSIGQGTTPGRVYKGKKMAGRMGVDTVSVSNLVVVDVDTQNKKLYVLGLVPGHKKAMLLVTRTGEQKNFVPLLGWTASNAADSEKVEATVEGSEQKEEAVTVEKPEVKEGQSVPTESVEVSSQADTTESKKDVKEEKKDGK